MQPKFEWQAYLLQLQLQRNVSNTLFVPSDKTEIIILQKMKEKYPGNYVLDWKYDPSVMEMVLIPIFENSHEETFWKLKYSNL